MLVGAKMIPRKATIVLFLSFAIIVAFYNCLIGQFQYLAFVAPFAVAFFLKGKLAYKIEVFGIAAAAAYIMACQVLAIGILGMIISAVMFFTLAPTMRARRIYLYFTTLIVFVSAYINLAFVSNSILSAALNALLYAVCAFCIYVAIQHYALDTKGDKPLADKCIETLEKSATIAQDALNIAKRGASHGRRQ
jgi:hypothetical protein